MKANEFRLGNLVQIVEQVHPITTTHLSMIEIGSSEHIFRPIPLTEEWLERTNLTKKNNTDGLMELRQPDIDDNGNRWYSWVDGAFNLEIQSNGEVWFEVYSHYIHVKYVHQLQNIYFALTGTELEIISPKPQDNLIKNTGF